MQPRQIFRVQGLGIWVKHVKHQEDKQGFQNFLVFQIWVERPPQYQCQNRSLSTLMPKIPHFQCSTWHVSPQKIGHFHQARGSSHCCSLQSLEMSCFEPWRGKEILPAWCQQIIKQKLTQKHLSPLWCGTADISLLVWQAQTKNPTKVGFLNLQWKRFNKKRGNFRIFF